MNIPRQGWELFTHGSPHGAPKVVAVCNDAKHLRMTVLPDEDFGPANLDREVRLESEVSRLALEALLKPQVCL